MACAAAFVAAGTGRAHCQAFTQELALATFDSAWARIDRTFYDTAFLSTRWRALRDSLRPIAADVQTNAELRRVLQTLLSGVGVSHFGLIPREVSPALDELPPAPRMNGSVPGPALAAGSDVSLGGPGTIGVALRIAGSQLIVWKVDSTGPAWAEGVRPGAVVRRIGDASTGYEIDQLAALRDQELRRTARMTAVMRANAQLGGRAGDTVAIELGVGKSVRTYRIARAPVRGAMSRFGNLPPINAVLDTGRRVVHGPNGSRNVGVISFSVWLPSPLSDSLNRVFDAFRSMDALILDLRGNPGGVAGMINGIAGHLLDSSYALGTLHMRGVTLQLKANPQRVSPQATLVEPFSGPVVVLIDPLSASATEFFTAGLQGLGRVRVIGETSAGASVPAHMGRLPNGDVMLHAVADHTDSKGRRIEGVGVIPDELIPLSASALLAGHDEAMEAALKWAARQPGNKR